MKKQKSTSPASPAISLDAFGPLLDEFARKVAKAVVEELEGKTLIRPALLNYRQAAKYLAFSTGDGEPSETAIRQRKWQIPEHCTMKIGHSVRFIVDELDRWIVQSKGTQELKKPNKPRRDGR
jgi:hypothetical protein